MIALNFHSRSYFVPCGYEAAGSEVIVGHREGQQRAETGYSAGQSWSTAGYCVLWEVWKHCSSFHLASRIRPVTEASTGTGHPSWISGLPNCELKLPLQEDRSWFPPKLKMFLTPFLHTLGPLRRTSCQIVSLFIVWDQISVHHLEL